MSQKKKPSVGGTWTTKDELTFLKNLGTYAKRTPRYQLLRNYLENMNIRDNWDGMDKVVIKEYVEKELGAVNAN